MRLKRGFPELISAYIGKKRGSDEYKSQLSQFDFPKIINYPFTDHLTMNTHYKKQLCYLLCLHSLDFCRQFQYRYIAIFSKQWITFRDILNLNHLSGPDHTAYDPPQPGWEFSPSRLFYAD
ncbi:hypothetical protein CWB99_05645 [Pseudoalteromonas rubra]|uniref:Uncharacterized protein n=1 Tax=Pseudoalteromonas rubra TaxID=43658 RepID=A0A5S3WQX5_9GAMM|nr:hypothetical protein CWB99_05645 [Pseudoalteromonas rubra]TMP34185.1 hypothetical protein CWC00_08475 [Pseudoalteromonas rubra]